MSKKIAQHSLQKHTTKSKKMHTLWSNNSQEND